MKFLDFWFRVFSEQDGTPSYSRVMSGIFLMFMLVLDIVHYAKTGTLPESYNLIAQAVAGNAPYLINKAQTLFNHGATKALNSK